MRIQELTTCRDGSEMVNVIYGEIAKMRVDSILTKKNKTMPKPEPKPIECSEAGYMQTGQ